MTFLPNSSCHPFTITLDPTPSLDVFPYLSQILSCLLHFSLGVPSCRHLYSLIDSIHAFRIKQSWKTGVWKPILRILWAEDSHVHLHLENWEISSHMTWKSTPWLWVHLIYSSFWLTEKQFTSLSSLTSSPPLL